MYLFRFGPAGMERPGMAASDGSMRDLSGLFPDISGSLLSPAGLDRIRSLNPDNLPAVPERVRIGPCVPMPFNFIAVGLNFSDHAAEVGMDLPSEPILFNKAPTSICGPFDQITLPPDSTTTDWEVELAVVIGTPCEHVSEADALDHIAGYCVCNDLSERTDQLKRSGQWMKGKSAPGFGPLGPWLATPDQVPDPQNLAMALSINGTMMQTGSTATMVFGVAELISYTSRFMRLVPGDVITTGTPPGVGQGMSPPMFLSPGDQVEATVQGLGTQRQMVVAHPLDRKSRDGEPKAEPTSDQAAEA